VDSIFFHCIDFTSASCTLSCFLCDITFSTLSLLSATLTSYTTPRFSFSLQPFTPLSFLLSSCRSSEIQAPESLFCSITVVSSCRLWIDLIEEASQYHTVGYGQKPFNELKRAFVNVISIKLWSRSGTGSLKARITLTLVIKRARGSSGYLRLPWSDSNQLNNVIQSNKNLFTLS
jgi:hypothetical protein